MKFADRLKFTASGTSAATITFGAAVTGFRTLAQAITDGVLLVGDVGVPFAIDDGAGNVEMSLFTITSSTVLTRTSVLSSSSGGTNAATFTGNTLSVYSSMPASFATKLNAPNAARQVATRCRVPNNTTTANKTQMCNHAVTFRETVHQVAVEFPNFYVNTNNQELGIGVATITGSIEYPSGVFTQLTFGGSVSGTAPDGGRLLSDFVNVEIPMDAVVVIRAFYSSATGIVYADFGVAYAGDGWVGGNPTVDRTMGGTVANATPNISWGPCAVIAQTERQSVAIFGDSNSAGTGDTTGDTFNGDLGYAERSIGPVAAYINMATPATRVGLFVSNNSRTNRLALAARCTDVMVMHGTNDIQQSGDSAATVIGNMKTFVTYFPGKSVWACTIFPRSNTGPWNSLASQTADSLAAVRISYNNMVRNGAITGAAGYFETAFPVESAWNSGLWNFLPDSTAIAITVEGLHANHYGHNMVAASGAVRTAVFRKGGAR